MNKIDHEPESATQPIEEITEPSIAECDLPYGSNEGKTSKNTESLELSEGRFKSGLERIILYKSNIKGKKIEIPCTGHTSIEGVNGAGKTSLLRLIPIFFGAEPGGIVGRAGGKETFTNWYLPSNQSFIAFQYGRTNGEKRVAVIYRPSSSSNDGFVYRFINGSLEDTLLSFESEKDLIENQTIAKVLENFSARHPKLISSIIRSTVDYRSILENSKLRRKSDKRENEKLEALGRIYSLGDGITRMSQLNALTSVPLQRTSLLKNLQSMIVETYFETKDFKDLHKIPLSEKEEEDARYIWDRLDVIKGIEKLESKVKEVMPLYEAATESRIFVDILSKKAQSIEGVLTSSIERKNTDRNKLVEEEEVKENSLKAERSNLLTLKEDKKIKVNSQEVQIKGLENKLQEYEAKGVSDKKQEVAKILMYEASLIAEKSELERLKTTQGIAIQGAEKIKSEAEQAANEEYKERTKWVHQQKLDNQTLKNDLANDFNLFMRSQNTEKEKEIHLTSSELDGSITMLESDRKKLTKSQIKLHALTQEELGRVTALTNEINAGNSKIKSVNDEIEADKPRIQVLEKELGQAAARIEYLRRSIQDNATEIDSIDSKKLAIDASLAGFLNNNIPEWRENIGKVLSESVLWSTDLHPSVSANNSSPDTVFGLHLELDSISKVSDKYRFETLEEEKQRLNRKTTIEEEEKTNLETKHASWNRELEKLIIIRDSNKRLIRRTYEEIASYRLKKENIEDENKTAQSKRVQSIGVQVKNLEEQIDALKADKLNKLEIIKNKYVKHSLEAEETLKRKTVELNLSFRNFETMSQEADARLAEQIKNAELNYSAMLSEKGIDPSVFSAIENQIKTFNSKILKANEYRPLISEYDSWFENVWNKKPDLEVNLSTLKEELAVIDKDFTQKNNELESFKIECSKNKQAHALEIKKINLKIGKVKTGYAMCYPVLSAMLIPLNIDREKYEKELGVSKESLSNVDIVSTLIERHCQDFNASISKVIRASKEFSGEIDKSHDPSIKEMFRHSIETLCLEFGNDKTIIDDGMHPHKIKAISSFMGESFKVYCEGAVQMLNRRGREVKDISDHLKAINREASQVSKRLEKDIGSGKQDFGILRNPKLKIISLVENKIDGWSDIDNFLKGWNNRNAETVSGNTVGDLPSPELIEQIRHLSKRFIQFSGDTLKIENLIELSVELEEERQGTWVNLSFVGDKDINNASSNGLSFIAILIIFSGLSRSLCQNDDSIYITMPIDEIGNFDQSNTIRLMRIMRDRNINIFTATPSSYPEVKMQYTQSLRIDEGGFFSMVPDMPTMEELLAHIRNERTGKSLSSLVNIQGNLNE